MHIIKAMVGKHKIDASKIAVLSQYRAQRAEITKKLASNNFHDVTVQTITAAQGESF